MAFKPWALASVAPNVITDWVVPTANAAAAILGWIICNTGTTDSADVTATVTSADNVVKATILKATLGPGESVHIDTKVLLEASATPDKVRVVSTLATTSFFASGDEG